MSRKKKFDDLMEAVTFAEVGEIDTARRIATRIFPDEQALRGERILAVSRAQGFSRRMVEHSIGMAERLDFGLVALSVPPALARFVARLKGGAARRPGEEGAWLSPEAFRDRAAERGIPFVHAVGNGDPEKAVEEVRRRFRRIAFLLLEPDLSPRARFAAVNIPIFYLDEP
jgi:hypothetical protein